MNEFLIYLAIVPTLFIIWWKLNHLVQLKRDERALKPPEVQKLIPVPPQIPLNVVKRSVNDILGKYMDNIIYHYVQTDDGRKFVFESVAVQKAPGVYHADHEGTYIIVDKCFLYREISVLR